MSQIRWNTCNGSRAPQFIFLVMSEDYLDSAVSIQVTASESASSCAVSECSGESWGRWVLVTQKALQVTALRMTSGAASEWMGASCFMTREWNIWSGRSSRSIMPKEPLANPHVSRFCFLSFFAFMFFRQAKNWSKAFWGSAANDGDTAFPESGFLAGPRPDNLPGSNPWSDWFWQCYLITL